MSTATSVTYPYVDNQSASPRVYHASLVDPASHSSALLELVNLPLSDRFIDHVANHVADAIDYANGHPAHPKNKDPFRHITLASLRIFIKMLFSRSQVSTPVILAALSYIDRAKYRFDGAMVNELPLERTLLSAIVVASKALNDHTTNNIFWENCSFMFAAREISAFERQFLGFLRWDLRLSANDILAHYDGICGTDAVDELSVSPTFFQTTVSSRQPQKKSSLRPWSRRRCPQLDSPGSVSSADTSLPQTPTSSTFYDPSRDATKSLSPLRKFMKSIRIRSRQVKSVQ
ncbi:hypothetical protein EV360DRAFT_49784 [Lentinula raphanica]|nr:hypothetical protein EV360DRAFT_49784 [Lentinula raphanica]